MTLLGSVPTVAQFESGACSNPRQVYTGASNSSGAWAGGRGGWGRSSPAPMAPLGTALVVTLFGGFAHDVYHLYCLLHPLTSR
jgi:hypothetical protein